MALMDKRKLEFGHFLKLSIADIIRQYFSIGITKQLLLSRDVSYARWEFEEKESD